MSNKYITLADLKTELGISNTSQDTKLELYLDITYNQLNKILDIDTFNLTTDFQYYNVKDIVDNGVVFLKNYPVSAITKINGITYTGIIGEDYQIVNQRQVTIKDIRNYLIGLEFDDFTIEYTYGYDRDLTNGEPGVDDELPSDIKQLQAMLVDGLLNSMKYSGIKSYKLGDESISFGGTSENEQTTSFMLFKMVLDKYKKFDVI